MQRAAGWSARSIYKRACGNRCRSSFPEPPFLPAAGCFRGVFLRDRDGPSILRTSPARDLRYRRTRGILRWWKRFKEDAGPTRDGTHKRVIRIQAAPTPGPSPCSGVPLRNRLLAAPHPVPGRFFFFLRASPEPNPLAPQQRKEWAVSLGQVPQEKAPRAPAVTRPAFRSGVPRRDSAGTASCT